MVCRERVFWGAMTCLSGNREALVAKATKTDRVSVVPGFCQELNVQTVVTLDFLIRQSLYDEGNER